MARFLMFMINVSGLLRALKNVMTFCITFGRWTLIKRYLEKWIPTDAESTYKRSIIKSKDPPQFIDAFFTVPLPTLASSLENLKYLRCNSEEMKRFE